MKVSVIIYLVVLVLRVKCDQKVLKQVLILSRHNVRTPLATDLGSVTPYSWPRWKQKGGHLTPKGYLLEGFMGKYFASWLKELKLLPNHCPNKRDFYVYANSKQRTKASAKAFVDKAFPNCNVPVHYNNSNKMDPIFNPVIHNDSPSFLQMALQEMQFKLESLHLNYSYNEISDILDYKDSQMCNKYNKCDLVRDTNKIIDVEVGSKPNMKGPLKISNSAIDAFIMEYYEGMALENVAWGRLTNAEQWKNIMKLAISYHEVIFDVFLIAKDISEPLRKYMTEIFLNNSYIPKVTMLMGHDANMCTLLPSLGMKEYVLPNQFERKPVGGKIVFERWTDVEKKEDFLKIEYVYQSTDQMRNGEELSLSNPAQHQLLELENCKMDSFGFCPWSEFIRVLQGL